MVKTGPRIVSSAAARLVAVALALATCSASLPVAAASHPEPMPTMPAVCVPACPAVPLYFLPGGRPMSPIQGDASGDGAPAAHVERPGVPFVALSAEHEETYLLRAEEGFRVVLAQRSPLTGTATATRVTIDLVDGAGRALRSPTGEPAVLANVTLNAVPARQATPDIDSVGERFVDGSVADTATFLACRVNVVCEQWNGDYGSGQLRLCRGGAPALDTVRDLARGAGACGVHANGSTDAATAAPADLVGAWEDVAPDHEAADEQNWTSLYVEADPPAWLEPSPGLALVPAGARLRVTVAVVSPLSGGAPTSTWQFGASRLELAPASPGLFGALAWDAENVGEGRHTGSVSRLGPDAFAFEARAGDALGFSASAGGFTVTSPSGGMARLFPTAFNAPEDGRYVIRRETNAAASYAFDIEHAPARPHDDAGQRVDAPWGVLAALQVEAGELRGDLDVVDAQDSYRVPVWVGQRYRATLLHTDGTLDAAVELTSGAMQPDGWARATRTGTGNFTVHRVAGHGSYTVLVEVDAAGDLSAAGELQLLGRAEFFAIVPDGDAVLASVYGLAPPERTLRVRQDGNATPAGGFYVDAGHARTADGARIARTSEGWVSLLRDDESMPIAKGASFALGPDGGLSTFSGGELVVIHPTRERETIPRGNFTVGALLYAPDGVLYATGPAATWRLEPDGGWTRAAPMRIEGFDTSGSAYVVHEEHFVQRLDLATGARQTVAYSDESIMRAVVVDGGVFALLAPPQGGSWKQRGLAFAPLDVDGFDGFAPEFPLVGPADLVTTRATDRFVGFEVAGSQLRERHETTVELRNVGAGHAGPSRLFARAGWNGSPVSAEGLVGGGGLAIAPPLAPGETRTMVLTWTATVPLLPRDVRIELDLFDEVPESDETNNEWTTEAGPVLRAS